LLFNVTGKHLDITEAIRAHAHDKASKLPKFFGVINQVEVIIDGGQGGSVGVEVIARGEHSNVFVVTTSGSDVYACIDTAMHKLERQLTKKKGKQRDNKHTGTTQ